MYLHQQVSDGEESVEVCTLENGLYQNFQYSLNYFLVMYSDLASIQNAVLEPLLVTWLTGTQSTVTGTKSLARNPPKGGFSSMRVDLSAGSHTYAATYMSRKGTTAARSQ